MKVKANEELFNELHEILDNMKCHLPSIVQNDMEIEEEAYLLFVNGYESYINKLDDWMIKVKKEIRKENRERKYGNNVNTYIKCPKCGGSPMIAKCMGGEAHYGKCSQCGMQKYYITVNGYVSEFTELKDALEHVEDLLTEGSSLNDVKIIKGVELDPDITVTDFLNKS